MVHLLVITSQVAIIFHLVSYGKGKDIHSQSKSRLKATVISNTVKTRD